MTDFREFPVEVEVAGSAFKQSEPWYAEPQQPLQGISDVVLIASGKGGVGKSTITVNLACALQQQGLRMGILDADLYGPSISRMMNTTEELALNDAGHTMPEQNHGVYTVSIANVLPPEAALVWKGPLVTQTLMQMFRDIAWPELDVLLVDLPPGTGDIVLSILEQIPVTGSVLVTTPQKLAVADATRGVAMFHDLDIPVFGLVENMHEYVCPCCGEAQALFPTGAARQLAERKHIPYLGGIPLEPEAQHMADTGAPMVISQPQGLASRAIFDVANSVNEALIKEKAFRERDADPAARMAHETFWENLLDD